MSLGYVQAPGFATFGTSGADGGWVENGIGREPILLQKNVRYQASGLPARPCQALGARLVQGLPSDGFLFPTERGAVSCAFTTAPAVRFSHTRTRLALTPMPGDIGGLGAELSDQFGLGWGVQFPKTPLHASRTVSQLFAGGLIVGVRPDRVLAGLDMSGYADCGATCRDFGLDGKVSYASSPQFGTKVIWHYSDAPSAEGVGLKVLQKSYDGVPPHDYVLFHFIFTNAGASTVTFYAGMFADWDIGDDPFDDVGATELDGRLMYMTDATPNGVYAGTLLLGAPVSGNAFLTDFGQSTADQVAALAGDSRVLTAFDPGDHRYIHALGPITLKRGDGGDIWIAIVAGEDHNSTARKRCCGESRRGAARERQQRGVRNVRQSCQLQRSGPERQAFQSSVQEGLRAVDAKALDSRRGGGGDVHCRAWSADRPHPTGSARTPGAARNAHVLP